MRHLLLSAIAATLMAQGHAVVGGTTDDAIPRLQVAGSDNGLAPTPTPLVWHSTNGKPYTQGPSGHLVPYHAPVEHKPQWWTYGAYGAAVTADYLSTRYALSNGATETLYRCNPHRAGCMNQKAFWTVAAIPVGMWLLNDLWLGKHTSPRVQRIARFGRKLVIGARFGVSAWNVTQGAR